MVNITSVLFSSDVCAALIIAVEFCWHTQHRSVMGFMTVMWGASFLHSVQKVLYAAALKPASSQASLYSTQTDCRKHGYKNSSPCFLYTCFIVPSLLCWMAATAGHPVYIRGFCLVEVWRCCLHKTGETSPHSGSL